MKVYIMRKSTQVLLMFAAIALSGMFFTGCSQKAKMARHQQRGDNYFASGDFSKAEVEYLIALRLDPSNAHTISRLGDIFFQEGRYGRAYPYILKACELITNDVSMQVKLGTIYIISRRPKDARVVAERILELSPTNSEGPDLLAESVSVRTEVEGVQKRLEALTKQIGDTAPVELAFGVLNYATGDIKGAEASLQRALTLDPKSSSIYYTMGNLNLAQNKMKEADEYFKKAAELAPPRSPKRLSYANFKIQSGDIPEGKRLIAEIVKQTPDYLPAWIRQAEIALAEKKYEECDGLLTQALNRDADNYEALFLRGRLYLVNNQPEKAVAEMSRMAALYDAVAEVHYQLALAHMAVNDQGKAALDLGKALSLRPKYPEATLLLAGLNVNKGDTSSAISALTQLIRQQPKIGEAYLLLGSAYLAQKDMDQAITAYAKAGEFYPKNPQVPFLTGTVMAQKKDYAGARQEFEKSVELAPNYARAWEELVNLDLVENKFTEALNRVNKAETNLGNGAQLLLAKIYLARASDTARKESKSNSSAIKLTSPSVQPDVNMAETALLKAIDTAPTQTLPYLMLAQLYVSTGKEQAALDRLNALVARTNSVAAYMQLGAMYDMMKDYPKARDAYEKVIAVNPRFEPALNNLSYIYSERVVDMNKALALAEKARELAPGDPAAADTLGWIVFKKGDYARARGLLEESAGKLSSQPEVQYHLGMARYMLGDEDLARTALQEAASSTQEFPGKDEAARRLTILAINPKTADAKTQADLEKRLQDEPNDPIAAARLGGIYEREGSLEKAAKTYEQSLKQDPQNAPLMAGLARIYLTLNQPQKALEMAKEAHKLAPNDAAISGMLGRLVFLSGDYNWASSLLQEAAAKLPNDPQVQYGLAWSYYSIGRVSDAQKSMQSSVAGLSGSDSADAKQFLALVSAGKTPAQTVTAQAGQILSTNADYVPAIMISAAQAEQQGKTDDAAKLYSKALARYPAFAPAMRNFAVLCSEHPGDNDQRAYDLGMKVRTMYPDDTELTRALGVLAYRRGEYARAVQLLQESSQLQNSDGEVFYYLGMAHYKLQHASQSKTALTRALALDTKSTWADDARKTLGELK